MSENRTRPFAKADHESENGVARQLRREDRGAQCARLEKGYVRTDKEAGGGKAYLVSDAVTRTGECVAPIAGPSLLFRLITSR